MTAVTTDRLVQIAADLTAEPGADAACEVYESGTRISHILFGLDIGPAELFLARQLGYHAVVSYSLATPAGSWSAPRYAGLLRRMRDAGVTQDVALAIIESQRSRAQLAALGQNTDRTPSIARLLEMPFVAVGPALAHTSRRLLRETLDAARRDTSEFTVAAALDALNRLPAFAQAHPQPLLLLGDQRASAGRVEVEPGPISADVAQAYFAAGVTTLLCFSAASEAATQLAAITTPGALVVLGRSAGESTGALAYIERLRAEGLEVTPSAGVLGDLHSA